MKLTGITSEHLKIQMISYFKNLFYCTANNFCGLKLNFFTPLITERYTKKFPEETIAVRQVFEISLYTKQKHIKF